jgi:hypothetical protein
MDLQWIINNTNTVKKVIAAVMTEETADDITQTKEAIGEVIRKGAETEKAILKTLNLVFDLLREPLEAATGVSGESLRAVPTPEFEAVQEMLEKLHDEDVGT